MLTLAAIGAMFYASDEGYEDVTEAYMRLSFEAQCATIALVGSDAALEVFRDGPHTTKRVERTLTLCSMFEHLKVRRPSLLLLIDRLTEVLAASDDARDESQDKLRDTALAMLDVVMLIGPGESGPPMPVSVPTAPHEARVLVSALGHTRGPFMLAGS